MISIIVPVYNAAVSLNQCIESILGQTVQDFELILVDDGSTDASAALCQTYQNTDHRIHAIHRANQGAGAARNVGLEKARGQFIVFIDADDWVEPNYLQTLLDGMDTEREDDIVVCSHWIETVGQRNHMTTEVRLPDHIWQPDNVPDCIATMDEANVFCYLWNRMYRRSLIQKHQIRFENRFTTGEDLDFNLKYFRHIRLCRWVDQPLYHYMKNGVGSLCARYKTGLYEMSLELCNLRLALYESLNMMQVERYRRIYASTYIDYMASCIPNMYRLNANLRMNARVSQMKTIFSNPEFRQYLMLYTPHAKLQHLFVSLAKSNRPRLAVCIYRMLFFVRNHFDGLYSKLRHSDGI